MNNETVETSQMSVIDKVAGIFTSPRETLEHIEQKPNLLAPYLIFLVAIIIMQYLTLDISMNDRLAVIDAKGATAERLETAQRELQGPAKYIGIIISPVMIPLIWVVFGGALLIVGNLMLGTKVSFKKTYSIAAWSSLVAIFGFILVTFLIISKGTAHGVALDLSILLPTPEVGENTTVFYRFLSKFDLFTIWQLVLWVIGLSVMYRVTIKKAAVPVLILWGIWIVLSMSFGGVFQNLGG